MIEKSGRAGLVDRWLGSSGRKVVRLALSASLIIPHAFPAGLAVWTLMSLPIIAGGVMRAHAASPQMIDFQGRLTDVSNNPRTGTYSITFRIFDAASAGNQLWTETQSSVNVQNGFFSVQLGASAPIPLTAFTASDAYLEIVVAGETLSPRQQLISSPFAFTLMGRTTDYFVSTGAVNQSIAGSKYFTGTVGIGTSSPNAKFHVAATNDQIVMEDTDGGTDAKKWLIKSDGGLFELVAANDAFDGFAAAMQVNRNGTGITRVAFPGGSMGVGTFFPDARLHVSSAAGTIGPQMIVSTGSTKLFEVNGASVAVNVPLRFADGSAQTTAFNSANAAQLASTQTFSGTNTFINLVRVSSNILVADPGSSAMAGYPLEISATAISDGLLKISGNLVGSFNQHGIISLPLVAPGGASTAHYTGIDTYPAASGSNLTGATLSGVVAGALNAGSAAIGSGRGGTFINWPYLHNITNSYAVYAGDPLAGAGSVTNNYGLYIEPMTRGGTLNYAIYSAGGQSYFNGRVGIGSTAPGAALHVSSAAAPAVPLLLVSTGTSNLFEVNRASVVVNVPLFTAGGSGYLDLTGSTQTKTGGFNVTGNVGIGTTAPSSKFDVLDGSITVRGTNAGIAVGGQALLGSLTAGGIKVATGGSLVGVIYPSIQNGSINITDDSTLATRGLTIANGGLIGINTSGPTGNFQVGAGTLTANNGNVGIGTVAPVTKLHAFAPAGTTGPQLIVSTGTTKLFEITGTSVTLNASSMTVISGGNVGIGTVFAGSIITPTVGRIVDITGRAASLTFHDPSSAQEAAVTFNGAGVYFDIAGHATASSNAIHFRTGGSNSSYNVAERMNIQSDGTVGMGGVTSPLRALHLIRIGGDETKSGIMFTDDSSGNYRSTIIPNFSGGTASANKLQMLVSDGTTTGQVTTMVLTGDGNVGIGTTVPGYKLDVAANLSAAYAARIFNDGNNSDRYGLLIQNGSDDNSGTNYHITFADGDGGGVGFITSSGGTVTYGPFTANHEARIPEDKNATGYPYGTVMCLKRTVSDAPKSHQPKYECAPCAQPYDPTVFGVYATKYQIEENLHQIYALGDGHVLVTDEGGPIRTGDPITTSSTMGYGMKAARSGRILGIALGDWTPGPGETSGYVPVSYTPGSNFTVDSSADINSIKAKNLELEMKNAELEKKSHDLESRLKKLENSLKR